MSDPESAGVAQRAEEEHGRVSVGNPFDTSGMEAVSLQDEEQDKESVGSSSSQRTESIAQNYGSVGRQQPELQDPPMGSLHLAGSGLQHQERHGDTSMAGPSNINAKQAEQEGEDSGDDDGSSITSSLKDQEHHQVGGGHDPRLEAAETMGEAERESTQKDERGNVAPLVGGPSTSHDTSSHAPPVPSDPPKNPDQSEADDVALREAERARAWYIEKGKAAVTENTAPPPQENASFTKASSSSAPSRVGRCFPFLPGKSRNTKADEASTSAPRASASRWSLNCFGGSPRLGQSTDTMAEASTSSSGAKVSIKKWLQNFFHKRKK